MKIECHVTRVANSGETLTIGLSGKGPRDADWRYDAPQEIQIVCTEKAKRAFWVGRRVVLTVSAR